MTEDQVDYRVKYAAAIRLELIGVVNTRDQIAVRCRKCGRTSVPSVDYQTAAWQPVGCENLDYRIAISDHLDYPREWLELTCRECDFSWNVFTDDVT